MTNTPAPFDNTVAVAMRRHAEQVERALRRGNVFDELQAKMDAYRATHPRADVWTVAHAAGFPNGDPTAAWTTANGEPLTPGVPWTSVEPADPFDDLDRDESEGGRRY